MTLYDVYKKYIRNTTLLVEIAELTSGMGFSECCSSEKHHCLKREMCVIRMLDTWGRFCRELIIVSASAEPLTYKGWRVPRVSGIKRRNQVIPRLLSAYKKKRFEPRWHDVAECLDAANRLSINNYSGVFSGLSISPSPLDELVAVRNYCAHHNDEARKIVSFVSIKYKLSATMRADLLVVENTTPGMSIIRKWAVQLSKMAFESIQ